MLRETLFGTEKDFTTALNESRNEMKESVETKSEINKKELNHDTRPAMNNIDQIHSNKHAGNIIKLIFTLA